MSQALRAKPMGILIAEIVYQNFPLRNSDKIYSLRPLRLYGEIIFCQERVRS
jgi:hypothetical protein